MSGVTAGRVLTPDGFRLARVVFDSRIRAIEPVASRASDDRFVLPGCVDLHVHGGNGADVMAGADAVRAMARFHASHGTTSLLATTVTAPPADLRAAATGIGVVSSERRAGEARVLGLHLEGPFINPLRLGAQPPFAIPPDPHLVRELAALAPLRVATYAPELDPDLALLDTFLAIGTRAQIGHSDAGYEVARAALARGAAGATHLFNAMSGLDQRAPGVAAAALAHAGAAEVILDLLHVAPGMVLAARRAIPGLYGITDATAAAGMPDGTYWLGRQEVMKAGGAVRLADGTLAGSALTMDRAIMNLLSLGLGLDEVALRLASLPARHLGITDRGVIEPGAWADLIVVDGAGRLLEVHVEGEAIAPAGSSPPAG